MIPLADWLERRRPRPPDDLGRRVTRAVGDVAHAGPEVDRGVADVDREVTEVEDPEPNAPQMLLVAAVRRLDAARARPGRVRESAFELLTADALVTYACEAALESERPVEAMERLMEVGRGA